MMPFPVFNNFFWELLSILSLTMFGLFYIIERISTKKYPMARLLVLFLVVSSSAVLWIRLKLVSTPYQINGLVDLVLLGAMICLLVHFIVLILRAASIQFSCVTEKRIFYLIVLIILGYAFYLYFLGVPEQFVQLAALVDYWIRPFWILVVLTLLAYIHVRK